MTSLHDGNRTLRLRLPPFPEYDVVRREAVLFTIPSRCVRTRRRPANHLQFDIEAVAGLATVNISQGGAEGSVTERSIADLAAAPIVLSIALENDTFVGDVGVELLSGFASAQADAPFGWQAIVQPGLSLFDIERLDDQHLLVTLPKFSAYAIASPELIELTVPARCGLACLPLTDVLAYPLAQLRTRSRTHALA